MALFPQYQYADHSGILILVYKVSLAETNMEGSFVYLKYTVLIFLLAVFLCM
jgi:hypothetical protein